MLMLMLMLMSMLVSCFMFSYIWAHVYLMKCMIFGMDTSKGLRTTQIKYEKEDCML